MSSSQSLRIVGHTRAPLAYGLALLLAAAQIAWLFPPSFLAGRGLFFFDGDISKDISGWIFFAHDAWRLPLLYTDRLNFPGGISIAFTDSIPLMALLFKPWAPLLRPDFHYFGIWHAIAFGGQALGAVFLARSLGLRSGFSALAAAAFALNWPILLFRFGHSALLAQGLLLFALGCYFRERTQTWTAARSAWALTLACLVAMLVHPYLMAMCYAVYAAFLLDTGLRHGQWPRQAARLLVTVAITLTLAALLGYFGSGLSTHGYGQYGLALTAPWCGGDSSPWLSCHPGTGESYAYLGAGALLLLALAAIACRRAIPGLARNHAGLLLMCALLTLFAITHRIHIGTDLVGEVPLPQALQNVFGIFQASARFFWPTAYLLLFAALACWLRKGVLGYAVVALAFALQWYDTGIRRDQIRISARAAAQPFDAGWRDALRDVRHINLFPAFGCGDLDPFAYMPVQYLAAVNQVTFNTAYAARNKTDCAAKHAVFHRPLMAPDTLYLAPAALPGQALPAMFRTAAQHGACRHLTVTPVLWGVSRPQELLACRDPGRAWPSSMPSTP